MQQGACHRKRLNADRGVRPLLPGVSVAEQLLFDPLHHLRHQLQELLRDCGVACKSTSGHAPSNR